MLCIMTNCSKSKALTVGEIYRVSLEEGALYRVMGFSWTFSLFSTDKDALAWFISGSGSDRALLGGHPSTTGCKKGNVVLLLKNMPVKHETGICIYIGKFLHNGLICYFPLENLCRYLEKEEPKEDDS